MKEIIFRRSLASGRSTRCAHHLLSSWARLRRAAITSQPPDQPPAHLRTTAGLQGRPLRGAPAASCRMPAPQRAPTARSPAPPLSLRARRAWQATRLLRIVPWCLAKGEAHPLAAAFDPPAARGARLQPAAVLVCLLFITRISILRVGGRVRCVVSGVRVAWAWGGAGREWRVPSLPRERAPWRPGAGVPAFFYFRNSLFISRTVFSVLATRPVLLAPRIPDSRDWMLSHVSLAHKKIRLFLGGRRRVLSTTPTKRGTSKRVPIGTHQTTPHHGHGITT